MSYQIKLLREARQDIHESIQWYEAQKHGLGSKLYSALKAKMRLIERFPKMYQVRHKDIRSALISSFPFQIHFRVDEGRDRIVILAVTHTGRDPRVWKSRT